MSDIVNAAVAAAIQQAVLKTVLRRLSESTVQKTIDAEIAKTIADVTAESPFRTAVQACLLDALKPAPLPPVSIEGESPELVDYLCRLLKECAELLPSHHEGARRIDLAARIVEDSMIVLRAEGSERRPTHGNNSLDPQSRPVFLLEKYKNALRSIAWSNNTRWQADCARQALGEPSQLTEKDEGPIIEKRCKVKACDRLKQHHPVNLGSSFCQGDFE